MRFLLAGGGLLDGLLVGPLPRSFLWSDDPRKSRMVFGVHLPRSFLSNGNRLLGGHLLSKFLSKRGALSGVLLPQNILQESFLIWTSSRSNLLSDPLLPGSLRLALLHRLLIIIFTQGLYELVCILLG